MRYINLSTLLVLDELRFWRRKLLDPSLQTNDAMAILERLLNLKPCHKPADLGALGPEVYITTFLCGVPREPGRGRLSVQLLGALLAVAGRSFLSDSRLLAGG